MLNAHLCILLMSYKTTQARFILTGLSGDAMATNTCLRCFLMSNRMGHTSNRLHNIKYTKCEWKVGMLASLYCESWLVTCHG